MATKIFIVDDDNIFREGLRLLIGKDENFEVVGEYSNSEELFPQLVVIKPDLIVLNLMLSKNIVLAICRKLYDEFPGIHLIGIAMELNDPSVMDCAFKAANGIVWSKSSPSQFIEALNTVISGKRFFNLPEMYSEKELKKQNADMHILEIAYHQLSNREQEVLKLFARGLSYKEIGSALEISPRTVESHKNNILAKLELNSVKELISFAIKYGLIE